MIEVCTGLVCVKLGQVLNRASCCRGGLLPMMITVFNNQTGSYNWLLLFLLQVSRQVGLMMVMMWVVMVMLVVEQAVD